MSLERLRIGLCLGVSMLGCAVSSPAFSQDNGSGESSAADIVVTARRVEERLQDVPISITVLNQTQIADRNIVIASDLATYTPSLSVNQRYGPETSTFALRGFVQDTGTAPSVGVYVADVVTPRSLSGTSNGSNLGAGSLVDLQNIQVLKGPQGTLFGRNTTGGAILIVPNKPTDRLEGYVEGQAGDYGLWRAQGVLNAPLADTFKVRLVLDRNKRDGYLRNRSGIGAKDFNDVNYFAARLGILADLTPDLENYTLATYNHSFSNGFASKVVACVRDPAARIAPPFAESSAALIAQPACNQIDRGIARGDGKLDVDIPIKDPYFRIEQFQISNTTTWHASDNLTIKNIASYGEYYSDTNYSLSGENFTITSPPFPADSPLIGTPFDFVAIGASNNGHGAAQATFSEELQFQGSADNGKLEWQVGGYFERSVPVGFSTNANSIFLSCTDLLAFQCINPFGFGSISLARTKAWFTDKALYGQVTYHLTDKLSFTGGLRYTWDNIRALSNSTRFNLPPTGGLVQVCTDSLRLANPDGSKPRIVTDPAQCSETFREDSKRPTWLLSAEYKATNDLMVYGKWARGYRQGGISLSNVGFETWKPEKVESYELGLKASFSGAVSGYLSAAAFYNDFTDQQILATALAKPGTGVIGGPAIINAGKSRIAGLELDGTMTLFGGLRLDLGYSYLDTKIKSIVFPQLPANSIYSGFSASSSVGDPLTLTPKHRVTVSANYTLVNDDSAGKITVGGTFTYTDKQLFTRATLAEYQFLPAQSLLNLNANWENALGQPIDVGFFMTNVTNKRYVNIVNTSWFAAGFESVAYSPPRMWGFRLRYKFGD